MTAYIAPSLQSLTDGPGPLTEADRGKFLLWDGRKVDAARIEMRGGAVIVGGGSGGGTSTIAGATDFAGTTGAGTDGYAIVWDEGAGAFTLATFEAAGAAAAAMTAHVGASDPHEGYLLKDGSRAGATVVRQQFTQGIVGPVWQPITDGAMTIRKANGSDIFVTLNTSTESVTIGDAAVAVNRVLTLNGRLNIVKPAGVVQANLSVSGGSNPFMQFTNGTATGKMQVIDTLNWFYVGTESNHDCYFISNNARRGYVSAAGLWSLGSVNAPTAYLDLPAAIAATASLRIRNGVMPTAPNDGEWWNDGNAMAVRVNGTNAVNVDGGVAVYMQSTTSPRPVGRLLWQYTTKTDATRATRGSLTAYYTTTEHKPVTWGADSSGALLCFYDITTPIARQVLATGAGATVDNVISALQALGLVKQS